MNAYVAMKLSLTFTKSNTCEMRTYRNLRLFRFKNILAWRSNNENFFREIFFVVKNFRLEFEKRK